MESNSQKQSSSDRESHGSSLKKTLAVATLAASLGMSLGVQVGDVFAAGDLSSPSGYSRQGKLNVAPEDLKSSTQSKVSNQYKDKASSQIKWNSKTQQKQY